MPQEHETSPLEQATTVAVPDQNGNAATPSITTKPIPGPGTPIMSEERVRQTKLKTILRYLKDYQHLLAGQDKVSEDERTLLQKIITHTQQLLE